MARREHLFQPGDLASELVFVETGLLRQYVIDEKTRERTLQFGLEGWWLADWEAFDSGAPASSAIQADRFETLLAALPVLEGYFRCVFQRSTAAAQRRLHLSELNRGEETYRRFCQRYPDFVQRVPQSMLASFWV